MRKRRSTVYVRPGKDVTLYVPTDTPPVVIDYLNRLKAEGMFSHGVMEIVTNYVLQSKPDAVEGYHSALLEDSNMEDGIPASNSSRQEQESSESGPDAGRGAAAANETGRDEQPTGGLNREDPKKWSVEQIFRQARHNSGKLMND